MAKRCGLVRWTQVKLPHVYGKRGEAGWPRSMGAYLAPSYPPPLRMRRNDFNPPSLCALKGDAAVLLQLDRPDSLASANR
jgi:hypothetical protein